MLELLVLDQELELKDLWNEHYTESELDEILLIVVPKHQGLYLTVELCALGILIEASLEVLEARP